MTRLLNRIEVRGGAGSGKTLLALTLAKELTRGRHGIPARRVALLCYSVGLASWFKHYIRTVDRKHRAAFVGTFQDLTCYVGVEEFGGRDDANFWEEQLPRQMAALAADLPAGKGFDAAVVDEAQDFADLWWAPIMGACATWRRLGSSSTATRTNGCSSGSNGARLVAVVLSWAQPNGALLASMWVGSALDCVERFGAQRDRGEGSSLGDAHGR